MPYTVQLFFDPKPEKAIQVVWQAMADAGGRTNQFMPEDTNTSARVMLFVMLVFGWVEDGVFDRYELRRRLEWHGVG